MKEAKITISSWRFGTFLCPKSHFFSKKKAQIISIRLKLQFNFYELWICCSSRKTVPITDAHPSVVVRPDGPALLQGRNDHLLKCFFLSNMKECFLLSNKYFVPLAFAESFLFTWNYCFVPPPLFFFTIFSYAYWISERAQEESTVPVYL